MSLVGELGRNRWPRIFGVRIRIHVSWLIFVGLIGWSLASGALAQLYGGFSEASYRLMAALIVVGLTASIVLHELAHAAVARTFGLKTERITLFLFGGVAELAEEPGTPAGELVMALAGPLFSVLFSFVLAFMAGYAEGRGAPPAVVGALDYLASFNFVLGLFNMIPAFPTDGGRVLRALIWAFVRDANKATRLAAGLGEVVALMVVAVGLLHVLRQEIAGGLWLIVIGLFLRALCRGARFEAEVKAAVKRG